MRRLLAFVCAFLVAWPTFGQTPNLNILRMNAAPGFDTSKAPLDLDFATGQYYLQGATGPLSDTRASAATCQDSAGNWHQIASLQLPVCAGPGVWPYEARTNGIRNNTMQGAVVGTARTISGITALSRTASASAVLLCTTCNAAANDLITVSGASVSTYNGTWLVTAATANTSVTFTTATNTTDSATGESVSAISQGTPSSNWIAFSGSVLQGLGYSIANSGTESGINFIDYKIAGVTTGSLSGLPLLLVESNSQVVSTYGQTWSASEFIYLVSGSYSGITVVNAGLVDNNSSGTGISAHLATVISSVGPLSVNRVVGNGTPTNSATAYENIRAVQITAGSGVTVNATFRIGWPQLENNSLINSSVASATVSAGGSGGTNGTNVNLTVGGGTCATQPVIQGTISGNALTAITAYGTPGSCTVFPPSPATVTGNSLSGASVNLTPTNNAAMALASPPILTSGSAVTRAADFITLPTAPMNAGASLLTTATPAAPAANSTAQVVGEIDNGASGTNKTAIYIGGSNGRPTGQTIIGGVTTNITLNASAWGNVSGKASVFAPNNLLEGAFNGVKASNVTPTGVASGLNRLVVGASGNGLSLCNCSIARVTAAPFSLLGY